jgi:hypothetical protein
MNSMLHVNPFAAPIVHAFSLLGTQSSVLPWPSTPMCELACDAGVLNQRRILRRSSVVPGRSWLSVE